MLDKSIPEDLRRQLKRRGVHLNTLHATLRIVSLDPAGKHYQKNREERLLKFVAMLGGIREPDLVTISRLTQPTLWRLVQRWQSSGAIRVVADYNDRVAGRRAKWLQPAESADLPDERRAYLIETAALIKTYIPLWDAEQAEAAQEPPPAPAQPTPLPQPRSNDPILPPVLQRPALLPPPITVPPARSMPPGAPAPPPPPVTPIEASLPAIVPPVAVSPATEPAPVIRLTRPPITYDPFPHYPPDPWEPDDPYRSMFEVTEHMVRRQQRERRERIARVRERLSEAVVWIIVGVMVAAGAIVLVPFLIYLVTGWDILL